MYRYGPASAAIYVHPAESGFGLSELKIASNGLIEFLIDIKGKPPDSTEVHQAIFSTSAINAVEKAMAVHEQLQAWAVSQSKKYHHPQVHQMAGQSFALSVGKFETLGSTEVYEIPLLCRMQGTICFPPNVSLEEIKQEFESQLDTMIQNDGWLSQGNLELRYGDRIGESTQTREDSSFLHKAAEVVKAVTGSMPSHFYGHSMSDIRYPLLHWNAPSFGIGPLAGDLGQESEWVDQEEYMLSIVFLTALMQQIAAEKDKLK
jgi:acetylornithine deacetylase